MTSNLRQTASLPEIIFFGNGPLADFSLTALKPHINLLFHVHSTSDLSAIEELKATHPNAHGILASFGTIIKSDLLDLFEPEGILNLHPSLLPKYRGPSPIETAILNGDTDFSISIMKLVKAMDAGPTYYQTTLKPTDLTTKGTATTASTLLEPTSTSDLTKIQLYQKLAKTGSKWLLEHIDHLPTPIPQDNTQATYTRKFTPKDSLLTPETHAARELLNHIRAFQGFPKSKITLYNHECIIHEAHLSLAPPTKKQLALRCADGQYLVLDRLQPTGKKTMDAISFMNGYKK